VAKKEKLRNNKKRKVKKVKEYIRLFTNCFDNCELA
jgi:hypothetical protein